MTRKIRVSKFYCRGVLYLVNKTTWWCVKSFRIVFQPLSLDSVKWDDIMGWFDVARRVHSYSRRGWRRLAIVIANGSVRPLQNRSRQGAPKESPKRRRMLAFIEVGDLLSKPSKAVGVIMNY